MLFSWVGWDKNRRALSVFSFVRSGDRFLAEKNLPKINEVKEIHISFTSAAGCIYVADQPQRWDRPAKTRCVRAQPGQCCCGLLRHPASAQRGDLTPARR
jgi:hypothetical protein